MLYEEDYERDSKGNLPISAFLGLLLCVQRSNSYSKGLSNLFFALKSHKSQAARSERGGSGTGGESNLTVFDFHKAHSFSRVREKWAGASVKDHSHSGKCYPKG